MQLTNIPLVLLSSASIAAAHLIPSIEERTPKDSPKSILKALAGTYFLVNTSR
jgi:hypothetical protein